MVGIIRILIADDHAIVREGLKQIVAEESDMHVNGEAASAAELFERLRKESWDIVILDINMPGKSGLEALKQMREEFPKIPALVLSMYSEEQYGLRSIKAGAAGYLKKVSAPAELVQAIRAIVNGGRYFSAELVNAMALNLQTDRSQLPHETLSDREYQILCKIALGESAETIAGELSLSIHTVYSYRNRIMDKLGLKSNVELTRYAVRNKLIEL